MENPFLCSKSFTEKRLRSGGSKSDRCVKQQKHNCNVGLDLYSEGLGQYDLRLFFCQVCLFRMDFKMKGNEWNFEIKSV
jgi:hypothetical protein